MTNQEKLKWNVAALVERMGYEAALERLEGTSPAGPPSESGCGDAERRNDQRPTDIPHGSAVVEAKGRVELQMALDIVRKRAANWAKPSNDLLACMRSGSTGQMCEVVAAEIEAVASIFETCWAEPRPQSGEDGDESCAECDGDGRIMVGFDDSMKCPDCQGTGRRKERSGLHNGAAQPPKETP